MVKSMIPIMLRTPPAVTISFMVTYSVPYATAFGGVATGSMNARDEATATVIIISIGFTARAVTDIPARTGIMMFATAVFEVNSVKIITTIARIRTNRTIGTPFKNPKYSAIHSESPLALNALDNFGRIFWNR